MISWHQKTPDIYCCKISGIVVETIRVEGSWWALVGNRVRGPISCLDRAMDACAEMAESERERNRHDS